MLRPSQKFSSETEDNLDVLSFSLPHPDPYSFQLSFVFPNWPRRFKDDRFKQLIYDILNTETPAHITIYVHWLNKLGMGRFEPVYKKWLENMPDGELEKIKYWLTEFLGFEPAVSHIPEQYGGYGSFTGIGAELI